MTTAETWGLVVNGLGALLVPFVLLVIGQWFIRNKEHSDRARQDADQLAAFLDHLSSDSKERRRLALLALTHMHNAGLFPQVLLQTVESIAARDDPEVAAAAHLALGLAHPSKGLSAKDRTLLLEVLLPLKVHFERSRRAFDFWIQHPPKTPNLEIEDAIKASNTTIRDLLRRSWHLMPPELDQDAVRLIEHYEAWLAEYERLRHGGIRVADVPYVFVGPKGYPFPGDAEQHFMERYAALTAHK